MIIQPTPLVATIIIMTMIKAENKKADMKHDKSTWYRCIYPPLTPCLGDGIKEVPGNISSTGLAKNAKTARRLQKVAWQVHWSYRCICPPNSSPCGGVIVSSPGGATLPSSTYINHQSMYLNWTHKPHIFVPSCIFCCIMCMLVCIEKSWGGLMQKGCCPA